MEKPKVAISGCLVGEKVRYDGQHKRHPFITHELSKKFQYVNFCPEVAMGLGIPRPTIKLVKKNEAIALVDSKDPNIDHTKNALSTFKKMDQDLNSFNEISGIIFTKGSPTCGFDPVGVHSIEHGHQIEKHKGLWSDYVASKYPLIPKIDSGRLYDDHLRTKFETQVLTFMTWNEMKSSPASFIKFHELFKFYILQYGDKHLKKLGNICSGVTNKNIADKSSEYETHLFVEVFSSSITIKNRTNVVQHMAGFLKNDLDKSDKKYLHDNIEAFHSNKIQFETLMTLIGFLVQSYQVDYLQSQKILDFYTKAPL